MSSTVDVSVQGRQTIWTPDALKMVAKNLAKKCSQNQYRWSALKAPFTSYRKAAVLVPLFIRDGDVHTWLTKRSEAVGADKGHVSFPGGMKDDSDIDEKATCLREAEEEIGLDPSQVEVIGYLPPRVNARQILITPVLGIIPEDFVPVPNVEVAVAFHVPLRRFLSDDRHHIQQMTFREHPIFIHFFDDDFNDNLVTTWGLTATMCIEIAVAILGQGVNYQFMPNMQISVQNPFEEQIDFLAQLAKQAVTKL